MAEKSGSRTHRTRLTRPTGFEDRAPHQGAIPFHLIARGVRPNHASASVPNNNGCFLCLLQYQKLAGPRALSSRTAVRSQGNHRERMLSLSDTILTLAACKDLVS